MLADPKCLAKPVLSTKATGRSSGRTREGQQEPVSISGLQPGHQTCFSIAFLVAIGLCFVKNVFIYYFNVRQTKSGLEATPFDFDEQTEVRKLS